jgi:hypothetical protein
VKAAKWEGVVQHILFVHGTGVRLTSHDITLALVRGQVDKHLNGARVHQCLWGDPFGARLNLGGASIPDYYTTPAHVLSKSEAEKVEQASWRMLVEDPLFEIRLLPGLPSPRRELGPGVTPAGNISFHLLQNLQPSTRLIEILDEKGLGPYWTPSYRVIASNPELVQILTIANRDPREVSRALARALVACLIRSATEAGTREYPAKRERFSSTC